jgi:predicted nucleic acid-binding protein
MPQTNDIQNNGPLFVDANVFLRFLTNDVPDQAAIVEDLFHRAAAGELHLVTNATVLAELVWVLESFYGLPRPDVQERAMAVAPMW